MLSEAARVGYVRSEYRNAKGKWMSNVGWRIKHFAKPVSADRIEKGHFMAQNWGFEIDSAARYEIPSTFAEFLPCLDQLCTPAEGAYRDMGYM